MVYPFYQLHVKSRKKPSRMQRIVFKVPSDFDRHKNKTNLKFGERKNGSFIQFKTTWFGGSQLQGKVMLLSRLLCPNKVLSTI